MRKILEYTEYEPPTGKRYIKGIENSILRVKSPFSNLKLGQFVFFSVINTDKNGSKNLDNSNQIINVYHFNGNILKIIDILHSNP